jgi:hypothetical protein
LTIERRMQAICVAGGRFLGQTSWQASRLMQPKRPHRQRPSGPGVSASGAQIHRPTRADSSNDRGTRPAITAPASCCRMASNGRARNVCAALRAVPCSRCSGVSAPSDANGNEVDGPRSEVLASMICNSQHQVTRHRVASDGGKFDESGRHGGTCLFLAAHSLVVQRRTPSDNMGSFAASNFFDRRAAQGRMPVLAVGNRKAAVQRIPALRGRTTGVCSSAVSRNSPMTGSGRPFPAVRTSLPFADALAAGAPRGELQSGNSSLAILQPGPGRQTRRLREGA